MKSTTERTQPPKFCTCTFVSDVCTHIFVYVCEVIGFVYIYI